MRLSGRWTIERLPQIEASLQALNKLEPKQVALECSELEQADLSAMWLLQTRLQSWKEQGVDVQLRQTPEHFDFLGDLKTHQPSATVTHEAELLWAEQVVASFGKRAVQMAHQALGHIGHFGRVVATEASVLRHPRRLRLPSIMRHVYEAGVQAIPIVALIAFFVAVIIAYIGASQLKGFGATIYTVDLITVGVLRELGVLLTAIIVAGRSGSSFAAEIGVMQLNDEVDALKSIGIDPIEVLVVPRVIGLIIALPLLTVIADAMGLAGGALLCNWLMDIPVQQFITRVHSAMAPTTFWVGIIKAPVFAFLIAMIGTYRGMQVRDSSRELGRLTTTAVVQSIFMVIFANAIFAVVFVEIDF